MAKPLIPQIYGYAVCVIGIVTVAMSATTFINSVIDRISPESSMQCSYYNGYTTWSKSYAIPGSTTAVPTEADYNTEREGCVNTARHTATRDLATSSFVILLGVGVFAWHWRWLAKMEDVK